jgi:hypothetical protein
MTFPTTNINRHARSNPYIITNHIFLHPSKSVSPDVHPDDKFQQKSIENRYGSNQDDITSIKTTSDYGVLFSTALWTPYSTLTAFGIAVGIVGIVAFTARP